MPKRISSSAATRQATAGLARRLLLSLESTHLLEPGTRVAVAVSGGADSVALLFLLLEIQRSLGLVLSLAHLNHRLRGTASDADEKFVAKLATKFDLPLYAEKIEVAAKAKREKANLEDAARRARYDFFARLIHQQKVDCVAVAHTADDQAETVLAHILRGTGLAGLGGIHPRTETIIRPLLSFRRAELRAYLRARKQRWREDATNRDLTRLRARIRTKLLPILERHFPSGAVEHLSSLAELAREDESLLDFLARERCDALRTRLPHEFRIPISSLLAPFGPSSSAALSSSEQNPLKPSSESSIALTKRILRRLMEEAKHGTGQITAHHVQIALELARHGQSGKSLQLPGRLEIRRDANALVFRRDVPAPIVSANDTKKAPAADFEYKIDFSRGEFLLPIPQAGCVIRLTEIDWPAQRGETKESGAVLDRDRLHFPLVLRSWRFGDRFQPAGHQHAHKLKRLLNEKHISRWARPGWPVLESGGVLIWARGFPAAADFSADSETKRAISIIEEFS
ncbi:MAG TPA: tRNA lysidine(34) synthetase TilS [Candidatus Acidoferrum sp.]|nr:tRNA lysidine(34) synthetase TilS [Candidatus Acidoferrum sp.]